MKKFDFARLIQTGRCKKEEESLIRECFQHFSTEKSGLSTKDFLNLCESLFVEPDSNKPYNIPSSYLDFMFSKFNFTKSGFIGFGEFRSMWNNWIAKILWPRSALIVVDVQNDFISGSLSINKCPAGQKAEEIVPIINHLIKDVKFHEICFTYDWHPEDHISFLENIRLRKVIEKNGKPLVNNGTNDPVADVQILDIVTFEGPPKIVQKMWPKHCVQNSSGAALHSDLKVDSKAIKIYKGTNSLLDSYSAFWDNLKLNATSLDHELKSRNITDVYICGLAYDVCVTATAIDALELGYRTILINDASKGVDINEISKSKDKLISKHCVIVESNEVKNMVNGIDRRVELAYFLALNVE
ncbi:pyrazinamidase/nicotinamidase-like protein [Dinothrombium tinctorium]|uniref:nicotinamidase n=1 Tax=Dinothrombium tinctorium TaxID=1965070 RepID=A0A3S3RJG7_9ACAR|nr:pyrazinamidase/nicotinamidase-like protein [Dinothrombium tinctorium]